MRIISTFIILTIVVIILSACSMHEHIPDTLNKNVKEDNQNYSEIIEDLEDELNTDPDNYKTSLSLGVAYYKIGEYDSAIQYLSKAIELNKDLYTAYDILGKIYEKQKKINLALNNYDEGLRVVKLKNAKIVLLNDKGKIYEDIKRYDEALKYYKESLKIPVDNKEDPEDILSYGHPGELNIAKLYMKMGKDQDAIKAMQSSLLFNNINTNQAYIGLSNAFIIDKDYDNALKTINKLIKLDPDYPGGYYVLGALYEHQKKYALAIDAYKKAIAFDAKDDDSSEDIIIRVEKFKKQIEKLEKMVKR